MSSSKSSSSDAAGGPVHLTVDAGAEGERLDRLVSGLPGVASREMARRLILQGAVTLNGDEKAPAHRLKAGDRIAYVLPPPETAVATPEQGALDVLHEDSALIVVNKPPGLPMHPGPGHPGGTLVNLLLGHCGDLSGVGGVLRPGIVHRLDMDTSGVVVAAKHDAAHHHLSAQFKAHTIHRRYQAIVVGHPGAGLPDARAGTIDLPLARLRANRFKRAVMPDGKRAVTHWKALQPLGPFCLMELRLETGRTHQIRVHLAHKGWPVLGDPLYGRSRHRGLGLDDELVHLLDGFGRQALHAAELGFIHPDSEREMRFSAPLPPDMAAVLEALNARYGNTSSST